MPQFLPFDAVGTAAGDPNFPTVISGGGGGGAVEIREFFPTRGIVIDGTENADGVSVTTITLNDATHFPDSGSGFLRGPGNGNTGGAAGDNQFSQANASVGWTGKSGNTLTGVFNNAGDNAVNRRWIEGRTVLDLNAGTENVFTYTVPDRCNYSCNHRCRRWRRWFTMVQAMVIPAVAERQEWVA